MRSRRWEQGRSEESEKWEMTGHMERGVGETGGRSHLYETLHISLQVDDGHSLHDNVNDPPLQGLPLESRRLTEALAGSLLLELFPEAKGLWLTALNLSLQLSEAPPQSQKQSQRHQSSSPTFTLPHPGPAHRALRLLTWLGGRH